VSDYDLSALLHDAAPRRDLVDLVQRAFWMKESSDTMNVIVRDTTGHVVSAVTTSGVAWKYPGRAGDSPIIGAGNYVDDRFGAAACMGLGEITIRTGAAVRAVMMLELGHGLAAAGAAVVAAMRPLVTPDQWIRILIMDARGNTAGYATQGGLNYKVQTTLQSQPVLHEVINS
jgi:beta-aspartyl-peptidase (threonine type)